MGCLWDQEVLFCVAFFGAPCGFDWFLAVSCDVMRAGGLLARELSSLLPRVHTI